MNSPELKKEGFQFIVRQRFDRNQWRKAEIQVVNIVTPAGILYECRPDAKVKKLSPENGVSLILGPFYPFEGTRLRTLNHVAAVMERHFIRQMAEEDDLEMLQAHLPGMTPEELDEIRPVYPEDGYIDELLTRLAHREEESPC